MHQETDVRAQIADLEAQVDTLRRLVDAESPARTDPGGQPTSPVDQPERTSRRRWIAGAGAAAAGAVVAASSARPAAAADPNDIVKDVDNAVSSRTTLSGGRFRARDTGAEPLLDFRSSISGVADTSPTFNGVVGSTAAASGYGVIALADRVAGSRSQLLIEPNGPPPPTGGGNRPGEIAADENDDLWYAISGSESRKLAGPATAGALHAIVPVRVFDSRLGPIPQSGIFGPSTNRTISVKDGYDFGGAVTAADAVPPGATAIVFNLTVTDTTGPNFISVVPGSATDFATSSINFTIGQTLANGLTVGLDNDRQVKVFCGGATGSTHVVLDVSGFYT
jgi:hypothetical protein